MRAAWWTALLVCVLDGTCAMAQPLEDPSAPSMDAPAPQSHAPSMDGALPMPPRAAEPPGAEPSELPAEQPQPRTSTAAPPVLVDGAGCCYACAPTVCCAPFCGPEGFIWASAEYLFWWTKGSPLPPLVTTSPAGTPRTSAGVLGVPGTVVLFGDDKVNGDLRSGGRFTIGTWLDDCYTCGIEANFFFLESKAANYFASSTGSSILARPFFNILTGAQDSQLVAFPGVLAGNVTVAAPSSGLIGTDVYLRKNLFCGCCYRVDAIGGYRFLKLDEGVHVTEDLLTTSATGPFAPGTRIVVTDGFNTNNTFNGAELGLMGEIRRDIYFVRFVGKAALGATHQVVDIAGSTAVTAPGAPTITNSGGLLAQGTNIGRYQRNVFSAVPEFGLNVGCQLTEMVRVWGGYTFLYWGNVARPGDQIDLVINTTQIPPGTLVGPARPAFFFRDGDYWAQGMNLGMEVRY